MAQGQKGIVTRIHDATCPGSLLHIKPLQSICPVCRTRK